MDKAVYPYRDVFSVVVFLAIPLSLIGIYFCSGSFDIGLFILTIIWIWCFVVIIKTDPGSVPNTNEWMTQPDLTKIQYRDEHNNLKFNTELKLFCK